jgi:branched-chain amino acid transport system substrate-binding protein
MITRSLERPFFVSHESSHPIYPAFIWISFHQYLLTLPVYFYYNPFVLDRLFLKTQREEKMKKKNFLILLACIVLLLMATIPVARAERGVTDTEIRIGQWGAQTGPAAHYGAATRGAGCYFQMLNADGGIHGRKIIYFNRDDGYMPPRTKSIVKELLDDKQVFGFVGGVGTAPGMAVKKFLDKKKVPWVSPVSGSSQWAYPPTRYLFAGFPLYCDEGAILTNYAVKELGKKRIAFIYQNDDFGRGELFGAEYALKKLNMEKVEAVPLEIMDTDLSSHCVKLMEANPDCVIMFLIPKHGAIMLLTAAKMGFKPQWMSSYVLGDAEIMYEISKGLFKDVVFTFPAELPASQTPIMIKYNEARLKYAPNERFGPYYLAGFYIGELMAEGLKRCGRDLTVENFVDAMETIKDFKGVGPKVTFGPNQRQGTRASFLAKCGEGGKSIRISDWLTSDIDVWKVIEKLRR